MEDGENSIYADSEHTKSSGYDYSNTFKLKRDFFINPFKGTPYEITDEKGKLLFFCKKEPFKLKEQIKIFSDKTESREVMEINSRNIIDFAATYDMIELSTKKIIVSLKRKGLKSAFLRDDWIYMDEHGTELGEIKEKYLLMAILMRWGWIFKWFMGIFNLIYPQSFEINFRGNVVAEIKGCENKLMYFPI